MMETINRFASKAAYIANPNVPGRIYGAQGFEHAWNMKYIQSSALLNLKYCQQIEVDSKF